MEKEKWFHGKTKTMCEFHNIIKRCISAIEEKKIDQASLGKLQNELYDVVLEIAIHYGLTKDHKKLLKCFGTDELTEEKRGIFDSLID